MAVAAADPFPRTSLILFGATGFAGQAVLERCIQQSNVQSVLVIGRKEPHIQHQKIKFLRHSDFSTFSPTIMERARGYQAIVFCLGTTSASNETEYRATNYAYALAAARSFAALGRLPFIYLSCQGAAWYQASKMSGRVKGDTERELAHFSGVQAVSFRAGRLTGKKDIKTSPTRGLLRRLSSGIGPSASISVQELAAVLIDVALCGPKSGKGGRDEEGVYENADIKHEATRLGVAAV